MSSSTVINYHTVTVCDDLPEIEKDYKIEQRKDYSSTDYWLSKMENADDKTRYKVQHIISNGPHTSSSENHPIFTAFLYAYNSHEDIILSPDDIWLMICIYFCQYVNENAEKLRELFVDHEGRQTLTIVQVGLEDPDWNDFLERIRLAIGENVKNEIVNLLTSNFSTTTKIESLLSCIGIMDTFQKYFEYRCFVTRCGIRNVHFLGTLDDWKMLKEKAIELKKFGTLGENCFSNYIDGLLPIIDRFIQTYEKNVDQHFWNTVMDIERVTFGKSGKLPGTYISGWFLRLCYGLHTRNSCEIRQIKLNSFKVPVTVDNEVTNESKVCYLTGGFHGVDSHDGRHKPVMSLAIIDDTSTIKPYLPEKHF